MTTIDVNGGTVLLRDLTVSGNVEYNVNGSGWIVIAAWPFEIQNSGAPTVGKVLFTTDILLNTSPTKYFICKGSHLQFGDTSLTSSGTRPILTLSGLAGYGGLIQNGTAIGNGYNHVVVLNLKLVMVNSSLGANNGWIGRGYFGKQTSNNKMVHCTCDWTDPGTTLSNFCGGIVGAYAENLMIQYCYTFGNVSFFRCGLIVGPYANSVVAEQCFSTGSSISGNGSGGIFAVDASNCTARKCYTTGGGNNFGGIFGTNTTSQNQCHADRCYSTGPIGTNSGGIGGSGAPGFGSGPVLSITNCYSSGTMTFGVSGTTGGIIGPATGPVTNYTARRCYSSGMSNSPQGGIYNGTSADDLIPGQKNYGEANHGNSGAWNDANASATLLGVGDTTWFSLSPTNSYILLDFGTSPYVLQNINPKTYDIVQTRTLIVPSTGVSPPAVATGYSLFSIIKGGNPTISINPLTGEFSTNQTPPGIYTLTIYATSTYTTTTVKLFVPEPPPVLITPACRFCYSYKPPGPIDTYCEPPVCATNEYLSSIATLPDVVNNSSRTSEQSLLLAQQQMYLQGIVSTSVASTIQSTIQNSTSITSTLYGQLLQVRQDRFLPYRPYVPPMIPSSVIQLQMNGANVGVPHAFFTIVDCKGSQSVTT
jgi:hypothetical protein